MLSVFPCHRRQLAFPTGQLPTGPTSLNTRCAPGCGRGRGPEGCRKRVRVNHAHEVLGSLAIERRREKHVALSKDSANSSLRRTEQSTLGAKGWRQEQIPQRQAGIQVGIGSRNPALSWSLPILSPELVASSLLTSEHRLTCASCCCRGIASTTLRAQCVLGAGAAPG